MTPKIYESINNWLIQIGLPPLRVLASVLSISSLAVFSNYYFSIVNVALPVYYEFIAVYFNESNYTNNELPNGSGLGQISQSHMVWFSVVVTIYNIGSLVGCFFVPLMAENLGRKKSLMLWMNVMNIVADLLMSLAWVGDFKSITMLIIGRFISGANAGMGYILLPIYLTEISSPAYRGFNASCDNLMISMNTLFSLIIALPEILGIVGLWIPLHAIGIPIAILQIILMPLFPESPKYLLLHEKNEIEARRALEFFQPNISDQEVVTTFTHYQCEKLQQESAGDKVHLSDVIKDRNIRRPIIIGCLVMLASISTGIVAIFTYSSTMFQSTGLGSTDVNCSTYNNSKDVLYCENMKSQNTLHASQVASIVLSVFNTLGAFFANGLIDRMGRRKLLLWGLYGCAICLFIFMIVDLINGDHPIQWLAYIGVAVMCAHVFIYNVGPGAIMWFICSEMTPQAARSIGAMLCTITNSVGLIILNFIYPPLQDAMDGWVFILFIVPTLVFATLLYFEMPETKNREVDDILRNWYEYTPRGRKLRKQRAMYAETVRRIGNVGASSVDSDISRTTS